MLASFCITLLISALVTYIAIRYDSWHSHLSHDHDLDGVQKFHHHPTPRIGGVGIYLGLLASLSYIFYFNENELGLLIILAALPAFVGGIVEDLTKIVRPRDRLLLTFVSAVLGFYAFGAQIQRTEIPWFDLILQNELISLLLTVVAVGGVSHSVNIIDGFNGLMTGYSILAFAALGTLSFISGDSLMLTLNLTFLASVLGLFVFNYPYGKIFSGDGGAYLIGFLLAESSVLLIVRNDSISPWSVFLILLYPVFEVIFSIYRRKVLKGVAISEPDSKHLHTLIYRRIVRITGKQKKIDNKTILNSMTAKYLWGLSLVSLIPAVIFWNDSISLILSCALFSLCYVVCYWRIVRFRSRKRSRTTGVKREVLSKEDKTDIVEKKLHNSLEIDA